MSQLKGLPHCHGISIRRADGLLSDWDPSGCKGPYDDVVQSLMSGNSATHPFANEGMRALGIDPSATNTRMWNANVASQPQTHHDTNRLVIETLHEAMGRA